MTLKYSLQNVCFPLETNASIHAVFTVLTRSVIESTVAVCMAVKKGNNVIVLILDSDMLSKNIFIFIINVPSCIKSRLFDYVELS